MDAHISTTKSKKFFYSIGLTFLILIAELIGGVWTGSLALLSDAAHVFMDVFALVLSYIAFRLSTLPADDRHTYGFHRLEIFAALINGISLGAIAIGIFFESWRRWANPEPIKSAEMLIIATIGLVVNLVVAFVLHDSNHFDDDHQEAKDLNIYSAYLHVLGDAISSVAVIVAAGLIYLTGWLWVDPLMSVLIGLLIIISAGRVLRSSLHILIEGVPEHLSLPKIGQVMLAVPGVLDVHDLHIWSICSGNIALSAHIVIEDQTLSNGNGVMTEIKSALANFGIEHTTIQFENVPCRQGKSINNES